MAAGDRKFGPNGACGEVEGTGSAITVKLDFKPIRVRIFNRTQLAKASWNQQMPAASAMLEVTAGTISFITSAGITGGNNGFIIGTNASLNTDDDTIYWEADRSF